MKSIGKIIDLIFAVVKYFIAMLFGWLVILVFLQVFNRFLLNSALAWSEEIANYTMMWIALLGASMLMRNRGHMAVNNLLDASKGTVKTGKALGDGIEHREFYPDASSLEQTVKTLYPLVAKDELQTAG